MFDISMYDFPDLPNKITYCNWRIGMVFNGTENDMFSHHHNIVNCISTRAVTNEMLSNSPPTFPIAPGKWTLSKGTCVKLFIIL